ncbi:histone deacetylase family protein [Vogesella fluminis]|uniref:Histone deacetylase n=1 Tax=Vogesella fluminis TaxID=1069161 RepID=A0ABQ3H9T3_9NEIS|nr:histone deacetylase family protein [Vogesella fluminis]GHD77986.1 histone deacetylase [Vogesella fluminis]
MLTWLKSHLTGGGLTAFISHSDCLQHNMGSGHPECPERLVAIKDQLMAVQLFDSLQEVEAPLVSEQQLARVHPPHYVEYIEACSPSTGTFRVDPDTAMCPGTLQAARRAAGAVVKAVDMVCNREAPNAFCSIRPPGHHAESARSMGFCFFNNIAVGIAHALSVYRFQRVAIVDFDVHHGNGTEEIFRDDPRVMMVSIFQHPFFPYSGDQPLGTNMHHVPLKAGSGSREFREAVEYLWLPQLEEFKPEMIFISAGFDAHREDDMASLALTEADYEWVTRKLLQLAATHCEGRIVSVLEGGYDLSALARSVAAHIKVLSDG